MKRSYLLIGLLLLALTLISVLPRYGVAGQVSLPDEKAITGKVIDQQGSPVVEAELVLINMGTREVLEKVSTYRDGSFTITLAGNVPERLLVAVERPHFEVQEITLNAQEVNILQSGGVLHLPDIVLARHIGASFWIATLIFLGMLALIATEKLHNALAALFGVTLIFAFSYLGRPFSEELFIMDFEIAIESIDWNVIFLIMGMMIVIAVVERTGIFQWLAFQAYRISRGRMVVLMTILMLITGIASAFLDNVTTMLLMTPITIEICLALGINPLAFLIPEVFASNVVGISTLIGTPTNILIGSYANLSFSDFLINLTPGVILAFIGLVIYSEFVYRKDFKNVGEMSERLYEKLEEGAQIAAPDDLKKAGVVGLGMVILFIFGEQLHLLPAVTAVMGATVLLVWIRPDLEEMIESVDWTTLVFFMALFIVIGSIEEVGLISMIAEQVARLVGTNLLLAVLIVVWVSAILSGIVDNIPFAAAMLPVVGYLTTIIPGAESMVLFYALSVGAAMGGNSTLIGSSPNLVTAGIAERAGYPITYMYFLKKGYPAMIITVGLATLWLIFHFL